MVRTLGLFPIYLFRVVAENGDSKLAYTFKLKYNAANTEAVMSSFSIGNSRGTFNAATSLQAIPVTLDGTAARAAAIRTLSEETPTPNVRRLRLDLAQSGTHLFRLRPTFAP